MSESLQLNDIRSENKLNFQNSINNHSQDNGEEIIKNDANSVRISLVTNDVIPHKNDRNLASKKLHDISKHLNSFTNEASTLSVEDDLDKSSTILTSSNKENEGLTKFHESVLSFRELTYAVKVNKQHWWLCEKPLPKMILDDISGIFKPGVNAIMGPSGSGKTSLLTVLGRRKNLHGVEGIILMDGKLPGKSFTTETGFVTQEDLVMGTLTVRENIMFSASLRLPKSISVRQKGKMVQNIVNELNLTKCADQKVGTALIRGISGGEKKRCNIGVELITHPSILFLDEPTTGLDASTAYTVVLLLKRLSAKGCNIIMSIHQPRYDIFTLFDNLILLSSGDVVYHGPSQKSLHYFASIGFNCGIHNNPADYFLDIIERNSTKKLVLDNDEDSVENETPENENLKNRVSGTYRVDFAFKYRQSEYFSTVMDELDQIEKDRLELKKISFFKKHMINFEEQSHFPTSFYHQLSVVSRRAFKNIYRNPQPIFVQSFTMLIYSFIVGSIYFNVASNASFGIQNRRGAVFFIIMNQVFGNMSAIELFITQKLLYIHETTNGFYRVSTFFASKIFCDLLPMRILPVMIVSVTAYWMIGLKPYPSNYFLFIFTITCLTCAASSIALCASCLFKSIDVACNYCSLFFVFQMVMGGLFVNLKSIAVELQWLKYISIFRYAYSALLINELKDEIYCDPIDLSNNGTIRCVSANTYMREQGIPYESTWDFWSNHVALICIMLIFWCFSYLQLRRLKSHAK